MKYLILTITLAGLFLTVKSQNRDFKPNSSLGIKQGINYSSVLFSPGVTQGIMLGYTGGLVYKYNNEETLKGSIFALLIELNYSQKGWIEDLDTISNKYQRKLNYIELPILSQMVFGKKKLRYHVIVGTSVGYLFSDKESVTVGNEDYRRDYYEKEIYHNIDFSGIAEVGALMNTKIGEFQAGIRYHYGFTDLFDTDDSRYDQSQNSIISFSITYFFLSNK